MRAIDRPEARLEAARRFLDQVNSEIDPAVLDRTVEMPKHFLAEHSSDIVGFADGTDEAFRTDQVFADAWSDFQDSVPTAKVHYLGEDDPHSYDLEDLVEPPPPEVIENIIRHGVEDPSFVEDEEFFVDMGALEQLSDWSVANFASPTTDAEDIPAPQPPRRGRAESAASARERVDRVNQIVARSRELATETPLPDAEGPPPPPAAPPRARFVSTHEVEDWQLQGAITAEPPRAPQRPSPWPARIAGAGLAITGGWAYATAAALPIVAALMVGALALLLLGGRNG